MMLFLGVLQSSSEDSEVEVQVSYKKDGLKKLAKLIGKPLCRSLCFKKS